MSEKHAGKPKRGPGRPVTRQIKLEASPEEVARAMFAAVKPPDPTKRKGKRRV